MTKNVVIDEMQQENIQTFKFEPIEDLNLVGDTVSGFDIVLLFRW